MALPQLWRTFWSNVRQEVTTQLSNIYPRRHYELHCNYKQTNKQNIQVSLPSQKKNNKIIPRSVRRSLFKSAQTLHLTSMRYLKMLHCSLDGLLMATDNAPGKCMLIYKILHCELFSFFWLRQNNLPICRAYNTYIYEYFLCVCVCMQCNEI